MIRFVIYPECGVEFISSTRFFCWHKHLKIIPFYINHLIQLMLFFLGWRFIAKTIAGTKRRIKILNDSCNSLFVLLSGIWHCTFEMFLFVGREKFVLISYNLNKYNWFKFASVSLLNIHNLNLLFLMPHPKDLPWILYTNSFNNFLSKWNS